MLKILFIIIAVLTVAILVLFFVLKTVLKTNKSLKQEVKKNEQAINYANQMLKQMGENHQKINERPNDVGFNNSVELLHKHAHKEQN